MRTCERKRESAETDFLTSVVIVVITDSPASSVADKARRHGGGDKAVHN